MWNINQKNYSGKKKMKIAANYQFKIDRGMRDEKPRLQTWWGELWFLPGGIELNILTGVGLSQV